MANPEHLAKLKEGVGAWNRWRKNNPYSVPDLSQANLSGTNLREANLTGTNLCKADLSEADLYEANLRYADLIEANLRYANASRADLIRTDLSDADLREADLQETNLSTANLTGAQLNDTNLRWAILSDANLSAANLCKAQLSGANLSQANLRNSDLSSANLQGSNLDGANLTDTNLWETQHASWSIRGVICERACWDENAEKPIKYIAGEFERLYSKQTNIELFYEGGLSTFELNTLPTLLHHLSSKHPDINIRLKTVEEVGGGAKIIISLGDANIETKEKIEADAMQVVRAQLALREDDVRRLQIEQRYLEDYVPKLMKELLATAVPHITFNAPVHTAALPSGNAIVDIHQSFNDNSELIKLLDKLLTRSAELNLTQADKDRLTTEAENAKAELQKPHPDKSVLTRSLDFLKTLPKEAVLKGAGKLGERAAEADWSNFLHQLTQFLHHLG